MALVAHGSRAERDAALVALVMRIASALVCLLIPMLATILGLPGRRRQGATGIGLPILLIVAHPDSPPMRSAPGRPMPRHG